MPRKKGVGISSDGMHESLRVMIPKPQKRALEHAALDRDTTMSELASRGLGLVLSADWVNLPILGRVGCGDAVLADENVSERRWLPKWLARDAHFGLVARGDSMSPAINDGELLLVRMQGTAEVGEIVVVRDGEEAVVKRLGRRNGDIELRSDNPAYPPIRRPGGEIIGVVISATRDFDRAVARPERRGA